MTGIAVGVASLIVVVSVMNGFNRTIKERHLRVEPHLVVNYKGEKEASAEWHEKSRLELPMILEGQLRQAMAFDVQDVILKTMDGYFAGAVAKGYSHEDLKELAHLVNSGEKEQAVNEELWDLGPGEVLLGRSLSRSLNLIEGDKIILIAPEAILLPADEAPPFVTLTIKGTFRTNLADADDKYIFYDREKSLQALKTISSRHSGFELRLNDPDHYAAAKLQLEEKGFSAQTWPERNSALFFALKMEKLAMTVFLSLSALITSFSILTVLTLLVTQKRRDVGLWQAFGLPAEKVRWLFAQVGFWLSGCGVLAGLVVGVFICWLVDTFPLNILPSIYRDRTIPANVNLSMILTILAVAALIAFLGSWLPTRFSARSTPSEALRG